MFEQKSFTFKVRVKDRQNATDKVRKAFLDKGVKFDDDDFEGGGFKGKYRFMNDTEIEITLLKKPMGYMNFMVVSYIQDYLKDV